MQAIGMGLRGLGIMRKWNDEEREDERAIGICWANVQLGFAGSLEHIVAGFLEFLYFIHFSQLKISFPAPTTSSRPLRGSPLSSPCRSLARVSRDAHVMFAAFLIFPPPPHVQGRVGAPIRALFRWVWACTVGILVDGQRACRAAGRVSRKFRMCASMFWAKPFRVQVFSV